MVRMVAVQRAWSVDLAGFVDRTVADCVSATVVKLEERNPKTSSTRAQTILRSCMLRRKKDSKLDDRELVTLPEKNLTDRELMFSPEEREVCGLGRHSFAV